MGSLGYLCQVCLCVHFCDRNRWVLDNQNCRVQTLLTLEVLYLYCSLRACKFFYIIIANVALTSFSSALVSAK